MPKLKRRTFLKGAAALGGLAAVPFADRMAKAADSPIETVGITPDLIAQAKREGTIMLRYASPVEVITPIIKEFEKQYGIKFQLDRKAGSLGNQQFATEERAGQHIMDVAWVTDPLGLQKLSAEGLYLHWTLPDRDKKIPANTFVDGWGYCPHWTDLLIPYNPAVVSHAKAKQIFKTWHGFLDPELKGKIGLVEPAATNLAFLTYMMFYELPQYGKTFFEKLAAQQPRLYAGSANGREDISAGAVGTFVPAWESAAFLLFLDGDKTAWIYPEIAPSTAENHIAISKNAPHPAAARLLAAWTFTEDGARAIQLSQTRPTLLGVKEERSAIQKLKQTEWWSPPPANSSWVPSHAHWSSVYPTLMPEMRKTLGWRG